MKRILAFSVSLSLLSLGLEAQSAPCFALNDTTVNWCNCTTTSIGSNGPRRMAFQFIPGTSIAVQSASVYTGAYYDCEMGLEIWSHDTTTGLPGSKFAGGTFYVPSPYNNLTWRGTNFDQTINLTAGVKYWFVWVDPGWSAGVWSTDVTDTPTPYTSASSNLAWSTNVTTNYKPRFRLFCNRLDGSNVAAYGPPTLSSTNQYPTAFSNDLPYSGQNLMFEATNLPVGTVAVLAIGAQPGFVSQPFGPAFPPGCTLNTDLLLYVTTTTGTDRIGADAVSSVRPLVAGHARVSLLVPSNLGVGAFIAAQYFAIDPGAAAPIQLVGTNAIRITTL